MAVTQEREITVAESKEFAHYAVQGLKNLGFEQGEAEPDAVIEAVGAFVEQWQAPKRTPLRRLFNRQPDPIEVALSLGIVWGNQVAHVLGWQWTCLLQSGQEYFAVVSPERAYAVFPMYWMRQFLEDATKENTVILLFNLLKAGKLPPSQPNTYFTLS